MELAETTAPTTGSFHLNKAHFILNRLETWKLQLEVCCFTFDPEVSQLPRRHSKFVVCISMWCRFIHHVDVTVSKTTGEVMDPVTSSWVSPRCFLWSEVSNRPLMSLSGSPPWHCDPFPSVHDPECWCDSCVNQQRTNRTLPLSARKHNKETKPGRISGRRGSRFVARPEMGALNVDVILKNNIFFCLFSLVNPMNCVREIQQDNRRKKINADTWCANNNDRMRWSEAWDRCLSSANNAETERWKWPSGELKLQQFSKNQEQQRNYTFLWERMKSSHGSLASSANHTPQGEPQQASTTVRKRKMTWVECKIQADLYV